MIGLLQQSTIEAIDPQIEAKLAHWNVKDPSFIALHELFERAGNNIGVFTDDLAERLVQLGGLVEGNVQTVGSRTTLPAYSPSIRDGSDHVEAFRPLIRVSARRFAGRSMWLAKLATKAQRIFSLRYHGVSTSCFGSSRHTTSRNGQCRNCGILALAGGD